MFNVRDLDPFMLRSSVSVPKSEEILLKVCANPFEFSCRAAVPSEFVLPITKGTIIELG